MMVCCRLSSNVDAFFPTVWRRLEAPSFGPFVALHDGRMNQLAGLPVLLRSAPASANGTSAIRKLLRIATANTKKCKSAAKWDPTRIYNNPLI
jgi:hypothetical protein